jgi:DNA polymerase I-like protein with 3'-5' exonuclease and polymerase domains
MKENVQKIMENILENQEIKLKADIWEWKSWKEAK